MMTLKLDNDGFLLNLDDWSEDVARELAASEGVDLSDEHFEIIYLLQRFYAEFEISPAMRPLTRYIKEHLGADKASSIYLLKLFPGSPAKLAAKFSGLPRPENCL